MSKSVGAIYFVQKGANGPIKIGYSTNVESRIKELQTSSDEKLILLGQVFGSRYEEHRIQQHFDRFRISGEWFRPEPSLLAFIKATNGLIFPSFRDHFFYEWIKRFAKDDSPLGDLARDIVADKEFPKSNDLTTIVAHLRNVGASRIVLQCFYEAWMKWSEYVIFAAIDDEDEQDAQDGR